MTESQNGGASATPVAPNRAERRQYRGVPRHLHLKAPSRRAFFAAAFDNWAASRERARIEREVAIARAAAGLEPEGEV